MDEKDRIIEALREENRILREMVAALSARVAELEARLSKNSGNSNRPPSSDGPGKRVVKNNRVPSGKKSGGQPKHKGMTKALSPTPDTIVILKPKSKCECGGEIKMEVEGFVARQVADIEPVKVITVEYRAYEGMCSVCGKRHKARFPENARGTVTYGGQIRAIATYLTVHQLLPLKRTTELIRDLFGVQIAQGTVLTSGREASAKLEETENRIKNEIIGSDIAHFDESGLRVNGKTHWLHSASTSEHTLYGIHEKRGAAAMDDIGILPNFRGTAMHDHWKSYYHYDQCAHGECNAHHLRGLRYLYEEMGEIWAHEMACLLMKIKKHVNFSKLFGADHLNQDDIDAYTQHFREILSTVDGTQAPKESRRMAKRLAKYEEETLLFMLDFDVPFTNNLAERDIRMPKLKQKISGGFRTLEGAKAFARIRGFISTLRKQNKNVLAGISAVFAGNPSEFILF